MKKIRLIAATRIAALGAAGVAVLASLPASAQGYASLAEGRAVFEQVGCNACHSYVSRGAAPSIRDLMRDFSATPTAIADATRGSRAHRDDAQFPRVSDAELRSISEWLAGISWPVDTPVASGAPSGSFLADKAPGDGLVSFEMAGCNECHGFSARAKAPSIRNMKQEFATEPLAVAQATRGNVAHRDDTRIRDLADSHLRNIAEFISGTPWPEKLLAAAPAPEPAPELVAAPAVEVPAVVIAAPAIAAVAAVPVSRAVAPPARSRVAAIRLEKGKARSDRLIIELRGDEPDMVDLRLEDEQLKISFSGVRLGENIAPKKDNWPGSRVVAAVEAVDLGGSVDLTISSRVAAWTYRGTQGKRRLVIDLTADAKQPVAKAAKPAAVVAKAAPKPEPKPAPAKPPVVAAKAAPAKAAASTVASSAASATATAGAVAAAASASIAAAVPTPAPAPTPTPAPAAKAAEPPVQLALAKPEATPPAKPATKARSKNLKYKDGSDLAPCPPAKPEDQVIGAFDEDAVKDIMDRIGCPQCHAYVQKKTGPPFREVIKKYKGDPACVIHRLKTNETHNDEGVTADIAASEFKPIADYVATRIK